jgi:hypothetical protein
MVQPVMLICREWACRDATTRPASTTAAVIELTTALSVTLLILIDELDRRHPGLKASYTATLARVVANEETRPPVGNRRSSFSELC